MAVCPYCHATIPDNAAFCTQCGGALMPGAASTANPSQPQPPPAPIPPADQNPAPPSPDAQGPVYGQPPYPPPAYQQPPYPNGQPYAPYQQPVYPPPGGPYGWPQGPAGSGQLNTGMLIWSIINILCCCLPLGIAGLVITTNAKNSPTAEEEARQLKNARTLNLIATIVGFFISIAYMFILISS